MAIMKVGRQVMYLEIFEIDTDKVPSARDDLDLCQRVLLAADPRLSQRFKDGEDTGSIKFVARIWNGISKNPVYPLSEYDNGLPEGLDEAAWSHLGVNDD